MEQAIRNIIAKIEKRYIFDSHFVIEELIKSYRKEYEDFANPILAKIVSKNKNLAQVHGNIANKIKKLIDKLPNKSWSRNISGNPSKNTTWIKSE
ncbi:MAG: hypothetical protein EVG15_10845 [Candidatus Acididesulfobacter diazotrophicus]|uniref:Uncharacterized protein n=1 Tax=Candidatus Acididesulfobacter diazotrophicus TaxID=2597226 RepID=A0A519BJS4_9DELT|nr:MAG: hypothetical protein EVG15_10845 [Candidatus Acididesulfobacter diazotrophicus]